jgi:hypothetical protein
MFKKEINTVDEFAEQVSLLGKILSYGYFIIFISFPIFVAFSLEIHGDLIFGYLPLIMGFAGFIGIFNYKIMKSKSKLWFEIEIMDPLFKSFYFIISGGIIASFLFVIVYYFLIGPDVLNEWPNFIIPVVSFILMIPIFYYMSQFRKKKFGGERIKHFRGKKIEIDEHVQKALDSLSIKYESLKKGSKWTAVIPFYKVLGYDIEVKIRQINYRDTQVAIKIQNPQYISKAKEIERAIDLHHSNLTVKT